MGLKEGAQVRVKAATSPVTRVKSPTGAHVLATQRSRRVEDQPVRTRDELKPSVLNAVRS